MIAQNKECEDTQRSINVGELITSSVQALVVKSDQEVVFNQEASIGGVKNTLSGEFVLFWRSDVSKESMVGASAVNAVTEKSVQKMQSAVRTIVPYIEEAYRTTLDPGSAISTWIVEIVGHVFSRSQSSVADVGTACERRERRSFRKALVQFVPIKKPKDEGEIQNCSGIMLDLVDRSDGVVVGAIVRVVKARTVFRLQRGDARDARGTRGVPWQQTAAKIAEGELASTACVEFD